MQKIDEEIAALWREQLDRLKHLQDLDVSPDADVVEVIDEQAAKSDAAVRLTYPETLRILEEGIRWLAELHIALTEAKDSGHARLNSVWALVGAATAYAVAVRRLVLSGLDGPARALLRSLAEALFLCVVLLDRDDLRAEYESASDIEASYGLWRREFSPAALERHLARAEARGLPSVDIAELAEWRHGQIRVLSQFVHLAFVPAIVTAMPPWGGVHRPGILGAPSEGSALTLAEASRLIWYFATLGAYRLFVGPGSALADLMRADYHERGWWNQAIVGRAVFVELMLRHWEDEEGPRFEPSTT